MEKLGRITLLVVLMGMAISFPNQFARISLLSARASIMTMDTVTSSRVVSKGSYDSIIADASERFNVSRAMLAAVIMAESRFNPRAVSSRGAAGLMQLMPATFRHLGFSNAFDPRSNIFAGAKYLRILLDQFGGDMRLAIAAYNAGPGAVQRYGDVPPYSQTRNYVNKVMGYYDDYSVVVD